MSRLRNAVEEYWDVDGLIKADADPEIEYQRYVECTTDDGGAVITLRDFEDYIDSLSE